MDGDVLLITGASSGIGEATARRAAANGMRLALCARSTARIERLAEELGGPSQAIAIGCDVGSWSDNEAAVAGALSAFGRLDTVFANAGVGADRGWLGDTPERWREMVLTNVLGAAYTVRAAIPALRQTRGRIVLTGSVVGRTILPGSLYSCTKAAVTAMSDAVRTELHGSGIRTLLVQPGLVATEFSDPPPADALTADDIARAVMFALEQPEHVNVNEITVRPVSEAT